MSQLTIRYDAELEAKIGELACREGISLNQAVIRLLRKGAALEKPEGNADVIGSSLDDLIGTWTDAEADRMREAERSFEGVDDELWR